MVQVSGLVKLGFRFIIQEGISAVPTLLRTM